MKKTKQVEEIPKKWDEKFGNVMEQLDKLIELSKTISKMKEEK